MKKLLVIFTVIFTATNFVYSQSSNISIGFIGSHFHNDSKENRISEAENPYGYGLVLSKGITKDLSIGLTGEYLQDDLVNGFGEEKDIRLHFTGIIHPFNYEYFQPYLSGGIVYTHRNIEYSNKIQKSDDSKDIINARFGIGINIPVMSVLFINGDLGMYTDGIEYVGWGSTLGFRIGL